jgi:hypothetical protein
MIDHTPFWYIFILTCIILLRAVAPLSIAYLAAIALLPPVRSSPYRLPLLLESLAAAEAIFYLIFYLYRTYYLQQPAIHPPLVSPAQRRALVDRCFANIPDCEKYISKWFLGASLADIKRDNIRDFFAWAFLNSATPVPAYDAELDGYIERLERAIGREFAPGRSSVRCLRLSVDNAAILHRSLIWYFVRSFRLSNRNYRVQSEC